MCQQQHRGGALSTNEAFTLRYKSNDLGLALYNDDKSKVTLSGVQPGTFLVVQNSSRAKAIDITDKTEFKASELDLINFAGCKIWLEKTTEDKITYATLAQDAPGDKVAIVNTTFYSSLEEAINASSPENPAIMLKDVTETRDGYTISKDNAVLDTNGYTLDFKTVGSNIIFEFNQSFTIKGSGNKDNPDLVIGQLYVNPGDGEVDKSKGLFLYNVYLKNSHDWYDALLSSHSHLHIENCKIDTVPKYGKVENKQNAIIIKNRNTEFYGENIIVGDIKVREYATETVYGSLEFIDGSLKKEIPSLPDFYGVENNTLSTIKLPSNWEWVEPNKTIIVENWEPITTIKEQARFNIPQDHYDYSGNEGYDSDSNCVINQVYITVLKANEWVTYPHIDEWIYGEEAKTPTATAKYGTAKFVYCDKKDGTYTEQVPTNPGTYYLKGVVEANYEDIGYPGKYGYSGLESDPIEFKILKKISSINFKEGVSFNKPYDGNQVTVSDEFVNKTGSTGNVSFVFEKKEDDVWVPLSEAPSDAGTYRVKAILNEDDEYATATSDSVTFTISKASSKVTITSNLNKTYDGKVVAAPEYEKSGSDGKATVKWQKNTGTNENPKWEDLISAPTSTGNYQVIVELAGNENYNPTKATLVFSISQAENTWAEGLTITGWTYNESANTPSAKATFGTVNYAYSESKDGTYTSTVPTNAGTYYAKAEVIGNENYKGLVSEVVEFTISKADTTITFTEENIDKVYDSKSIDTPEVTKTGSTKDLTFKWSKKDGTELTDKPSDVGEYTLKVSVEEDDNYNSASVSKDFVITIADNTWTNELTIKGWTYGQNANKPNAKATFGTVNYTYSESKDGTYVDTVPTNAGTYYVKAEVIGNENYKGLVSEAVEFTISKANTTLTITAPVDKTYDGNTVSDPKYKLEGNTNTVTIEWLKKDGTKLTDKPSEVGEYKVVVKVNEDTNYNSASDTKEFTISKADNTWIDKLTIKNWVYGETANTPTAKSKFGDVVFSYSDKKDGTYTNTVPTNAGTYYVKATVEGTSNYTSLTSDPVTFTISKASSEVTITSNLNKTYDGKQVAEPTYQKNGSTGSVSIKYQEYKDSKWNDLSKAPTSVGKYRVVVKIEEDTNYNSASDTKEFTISKADNTWTTPLTINGWTYGEKANKPNASSTFGTVNYAYSESKDGTYTSTVPTNAGTYYAKAEVIGNENYKGLVSEVVEFTISKADTTITFTEENIDKVYDSKSIDTPEVTKTGSTKDLTFKWSKKDGTELTDKPSDVGEYTLKVSVEEDDNYNSASVSKDFVITIADNTWTNELTIKGWTYGQNANKPNAKATFGTVNYTYSESKDGTYVDTVPTNAGTYYVKAEVIGNENYKGLVSEAVEFTISKANTTLTITAPVDKTYDGNTVSDPKYKLEGNTNTVTIEWLKKDGTKLTDKPSEVGEYKVVVKVNEDTNYNSASDTKEFTISKADNTWIDKLTIKNWVYGETANTPTAKSKFGDVVFSYSDKKDGTYTNTVPTNAGTYYVKATVEGTSNYTGLVSDPVEFTISKADPVLKTLSTLTIEHGKTLSDLGLPEGYKWKNPNYECKDLGAHTYKVVFTPKDSVNYNTLDVDVSVNVITKAEVNNPTPSVDSNVTTNRNNNNNNSYVGNGDSTTSSVLLNELKEVVNKSEYKSYEKAYTKESYDNYLDAFENAEKVLNNENSSKEEIKVALDKLNEAISNLKVDKSILQASLVEFEELDSEKYSEVSYKVLLSAIEKAKAIIEDEKASPEEIANAIEELNNAYSSLQGVEPKAEAPKKSSVGKVALITTVTTVVVAGGGSYLWILLKKFRGMK